MLALERRDLHTKHPSTYLQEGRPTHKRPTKQKQKPKAERKTYVAPQSQAKTNSNGTRVKNGKGGTAVTGQEKHVKPTGKKNRSVPQEAIVLTKSQLQEILEAAGLQISDNTQEGNNDGIEKSAASVSIPSQQRPSPGSCNASSSGNHSPNSTPTATQHLLTVPVSQSDVKVFLSASDNDEHHQDSQTRAASVVAVGNEEALHSSLRKMSLLEQKRLQWARERAQLQVASDWSPWGKPGCGAPLSIGSGSRKQPVEWTIANKHSTGSSQSVRLTGVGDPGRTVLPPLPQTTPAAKKTPLALRSSLTLTYSPSPDAAYSNKEEEKQKWLEELDRQRDEQRLRRLLEQEALHSNSQVAVERINISPPNQSPLRTPVTLPASFSPTLPPVAEHGYDSFNAPMACTETVTIQRSFLRGANIPLDPETRADLERKRQRQREVQLEIEAQLEDKQRRLKEEKERQREEELREEERIAKEQHMLEEQKRVEESRIKAKVKGLSVACTPENVPTVAIECSRGATDEKSTLQPVAQQSCQEMQHSSSDVAVDADGDQMLGQAENPDTSQHASLIARVASPYIRNRILTPTKYRGSDASSYPPRECGTQTDSSLPRRKDVGIDAEYATQEKEQRAKKGNLPDDSSRKASKNDPKNGKKKDNEEKFMQRPKWGSHQTEKVYLKQSEKDPKYLTRRQLHEMRQKRLEHEAAIQCAMPHFGRTRSSAKHQRQLLANEDNSPITATPRRSPSPVGMDRRSLLESPFYDDHATESAVRRQRRQWDSPRTDEIPNFYTQPHQLPARRNSHSQSSRSVTTATPERHSPMKGNHDIPLVTPSTNVNQPLSSWNSASELRTLSPPVPSLRHRVQSMENVHLAARELSGGERAPSALGYKLGRESSSESRQSSYRDTSSEGIRAYIARKNAASACSRYSSEKDVLPYMRSTVTLDSASSPSTGSQRYHRPHNSKILEQLSAIRQGLIKKQQEMEHFLHPGEGGPSAFQS